MPNTIDASFGLDLSPLKRDFAQAAVIASAGSAQVVTAMKTQLAGATQAARTSTVNWANVAAQRGALGPAFRTSANFMPAPPGKYKSPAEQEAEGEVGSAGRGNGIPGLRFFRSVTITTIFAEIINKVVEALEKIAKFRLEVQNLTKLAGTGMFRGFDEIQQSLSGASNKIKEITDEQNFRKSSGFRGFVDRLTGVSDEELETSKKALRERASKDISDMAEHQGRLNTAQREGLTGSEEQSDVLREEELHRQNLIKLAEAESAAGVQNNAARNEENARSEIALRAIHQRFEISNRLLAVEQDEANLAATSASIGERRIAQRRNELGLIQDRLHFNDLSSEQRKGLEVQKTRAETAVHETEREYYFNPKLRAQEMRDKIIREAREKEFARTGGLLRPHFGMSGAVIGGTDPITSQIVDRSDSFNWRAHFGSNVKMTGPTESQYAVRPLTRDDMDALLRKYWGES